MSVPNQSFTHLKNMKKNVSNLIYKIKNINVKFTKLDSDFILVFVYKIPETNQSN